MLKITHLTQPNSAGVATYIIGIIKYLNKEDFCQEVILPSGNSQLLEMLEEIPNRYYHVDLSRDLKITRDVKNFIRLFKYLKNNRPDILHCHSSIAGVHGRLAAKLLRIKVAYTPNAFYYLGFKGWKHSLYKSIEIFLKKFTDRLIACSESEYRQALTDIKFLPKNVSICNNSVKIIDNCIPETKKKKNNISIIGRNCYQKNLEMFIKVALKMLQWDNGYQYSLIGIGDDKAENNKLKEMVTSEFKNNFNFIEWVNKEELIKYVIKSDLFLMTSRYEGLPFSAIEVQSLGKPIVATNVDGIRDVILHGYNGYLVEEGNVDSMSEYSVNLLSNHELYCTMSSNSKRNTINKFDIKKNILILENTYKNLHYH